MFKKTPNVKASSNLKNSERKKLLQSCKEQRNSSDYNFPSSIIKQANYKGQTSAGTVYTDEQNVPIWFKEKHSDMLFPSVYTCWKNPKLLPIIVTNSYVIEEKILNGANLMISGTLLPFDERLICGALCGIASYKKPNVVMAIGIVQLDLQSYTKVVGETGVAVNVLHYLGDGLSDSFKMNLEPPETGAEVDETNEMLLNQDKQDVNNELTNSNKDLAPDARPNDDLAEVLETLPVDIIDDFITKSLYYSLTNDPKLEFPISASNFISNYIMSNLPPVDNDMVNLKKSSWKKTAKFLRHFEKEGFIKLKGKNDDLVITGFNKEKTELKSFVPYRTGNGNSTKSKKDKTNDTSDNGDMMQSVSYYKPISLGKDLIRESVAPEKSLYTAHELRDFITEYINKKNLVDSKNKKMILMDDLMYSLVYKKKNSAEPRLISRADVIEPITKNNFNEHFQIYKKGDNETAVPLFKKPIRGSIPKVEIVTEMKIGRKVITRVSNFEVFHIDAETLAADLRKLCNGATTIGETLTSPKTAEVQVQGPHSQVIIKHLNSLSIPTKWIDFKNSVKPKRKKNKPAFNKPLDQILLQ
ncbi:hypothetical protein TPHA_0J00780 [Tetrapisispora phaffii CBS 4417]|uniref:SUI1 domain-containing protein n=1 Tax=Tetrapisispora phaffii (strain ATCC 24235 / CBS 4417 / NBRC 1672 / NRRL Y-8282 / UCD 70-5) TaxID=1071381 RepID=G8BYF9_TETPH|nr:hypothetical protein TPHA_0J00780 [Tetrapisispora phaffii CBS 4417]CCE64901.1 hypothetical protein TPHA_0J00780 [Tetrapisispora phaffii CBS 4417]